MRNNIIVNIYQHSDTLVMLIIIGLLLVSVVTWALFFNKYLFLVRSNRLLLYDLSLIKRASSIEEIISSLMIPKYFLSFPVMLLLEDVVSELYLSWYMDVCIPSQINNKTSIKERVMICLERRVVGIRNFIEKGNIYFSTVASVSPFIGLFGTIWSITKYFFNFSYGEFMNVSMMSSGIAEALILAGFGLFVAIPALIMHNIFLRKIIVYEDVVDDCAAYLVLLLIRDLDAEVKVSHHVLLDVYKNCSLGNKTKKKKSFFSR